MRVTRDHIWSDIGRRGFKRECDFFLSIWCLCGTETSGGGDAAQRDRYHGPKKQRVLIPFVPGGITVATIQRVFPSAKSVARLEPTGTMTLTFSTDEEAHRIAEMSVTLAAKRICMFWGGVASPMFL